MSKVYIIKLTNGELIEVTASDWTHGAHHITFTHGNEIVFRVDTSAVAYYGARQSVKNVN